MLKVFFIDDKEMVRLQTQWIAFLFSVGTVTLAEMGDKTQLLAMAFATRFKASKVLIGVFAATVLNHALAVAVGNMLTRFQAVEVWIQGLATLSFIFFGLWTIRGDKLDGEENRTSKYGAVLTVAIAFFIAELGDKTQLATIALAARFPQTPAAILMGTTTGMLIADWVGICVGAVACRRIPERTVKVISAAAFILFGLIGIYQFATAQMGWAPAAAVGGTAGIAVLTGSIVCKLLKADRG
jgi:putative Ca2+/H+ antiporter (TMEM165/GDT1 family)